jgi:hypothetical protein
MKKLSEGKQVQTESTGKDYSKVSSLLTEIICSHTGVCPLC